MWEKENKYTDTHSPWGSVGCISARSESRFCAAMATGSCGAITETEHMQTHPASLTNLHGPLPKGRELRPTTSRHTKAYIDTQMRSRSDHTTHVEGVVLCCRTWVSVGWRRSTMKAKWWWCWDEEGPQSTKQGPGIDLRGLFRAPSVCVLTVLV